MFWKRASSFLLLLCVLTFLTGAAQTRTRSGIHAKFGAHIAAVLEKAGCPLSQRQMNAISTIAPGTNAREMMSNILTDAQETALRTAMGKMGGHHVFLRGMAAQLEKAGCPLTARQIEAIKSLKTTGGGRDALMNILTVEQKTALRKPFVNHLSARLEKAGCPLTADQLAAIRTVTPGPDARGKVKAILTSEQIAALGKALRESAATTESSGSQTGAKEIPAAFNMLKQNYPNPFNPSTTIQYSIANPGHVRVSVYGMNGQLIATLADSYQNAGWHSVTWNAGSIAGGTYICTIASGSFTQSRKMTFLK